MQIVDIKAGTSATITLSPKINGSPVGSSQFSGMTLYVFFVRQFTDDIYTDKIPKFDKTNLANGKFTLTLSPSDTLAMLGNASENQRYEMQFAIKNGNDVIAEEKDSNIVINITKWEAGKWIASQK